MLKKNDELIRNVGEKTKDKKYKHCAELNELDLSRPLIFKISDRLFRIDKHSGKRRGPKNVLIETNYVVQETEGVTEYQYYTTSKRRGGDKGSAMYLDYEPAFINFTEGKIVCDPSNLDLITFLLSHPKRAGGKNRSTEVRPIFYLDDPIKKNRDQAEERKLMAKVGSLIYDKMNEEKLRNMAAAFMIGDSQRLTVEEIQNKLFDVAKKNPSKLLDAAIPNQDMQIRTMIGKAQEFGYLKHDRQAQEWLVASDKKDFRTICKTTQADAPTDRLVDYFNRFDEDGLKDRLYELVEEESKPVEVVE